MITKVKTLKSPLRYPGGKQKALAEIVSYFPAIFSEYREPFIGGGSILLHIRDKFKVQCWGNDLNPDVANFWQHVKNNLDALVEEVTFIRDADFNGKDLYNRLAATNVNEISPLTRAARFFILNRITFSGTIESGGYSQGAFDRRFTPSSIARLANLRSLNSPSVEFTEGDYETLLIAPGYDVFIYLDPPYMANKKSRLYGNKGDLHTTFDHQRLAKVLDRCPHRWVMTYDDCEEVRDLYGGNAFIYEMDLQYGMNNYKQTTAKKGKELIITNCCNL